MSGPGTERSLTTRDLLLAALASALVLLLGAAGVQRSRTVVVERRAASDSATVTGVAAAVVGAVERERLSTAADALRAVTSPAAVDGYIGAGSAGQAVDSELPPQLRTDRTVAALFDRARDTGDALLSGPVELRVGPRALVVAAVYDVGVGTPTTTMARRERLRGWVVRVVDVAEAARAVLPPGHVASVRDGSSVALASAEPPPEHLPEQTVEVAGRQLAVRAGDPEPVGIEPVTAGLAVAAVLLAAGAGGAVVLTARALRASASSAEDREAQVRLIGEVAPLVQESLELADVLPAVAVQLMDHFGLEGVSLSSVTGGAAQVELFSFGTPPAADTTPVLHPPDRVRSGETLALALQRGGRSVAMLQLVAGRELDGPELQSLRALTELVTAAVVNAALYASQQEALRRLKELDALKTVFLGTASHELRTPATAIGGFASLLVANWDRFDDAQRRDFVARIGANARSLGAVVQDLLDFSLLDKGALSVTVEPVDLEPLVRSVVDRLGPMFTSHTVSFRAESAPPVAGDVNGLERIVTNLLTNAVKFSPAGTEISVAVGPAPDGYGAQLVVADQGPGVPPNERAQIFTRFYRGSGDAVVQTRGVGIGLSVVAEFVARLRGDIVVDDAPGGGARFTVRLPAASDQLMAKEAGHASAT